MICRNIKSKMPDLLLAPESVPEDVRQHVKNCSECAQELRELQATMAALDVWEAPGVSPYFDGRMAAMLREEQQAAPAGWLERIRTRFLFGDKMPLRPLAAGALALVIAVGGGMYGVFSDHAAPTAQAASPVIRDLQSLDENAQVFQQLNSMDQQQDTGDNTDNGPSSL
jgi:hypothetical protein